MKSKIFFANLIAVTFFACCIIAVTANAQSAPLTAGDQIPLPGLTGKFDFIRYDANQNRLLLGHEGNHTFDVFDLASKKLLKAVPTGTSQDSAVDVKRHSYYVSGNDPGRLVIVDADQLTVSGEVPMGADCDLIAYDPQTGLVHICNDTAAEQWLVDPATKKIVAAIHFDGTGMEDMALDLKNRKLYQAVKGTNAIAKVDLDSNQVLATWPLDPDKGPHGIAFVSDMNDLLVACASKLVLLDCSTGNVIASVPVAARVDEMVYDPALHRAYCAGRQGKISVIAVATDKLTPLGDVPDATGTGDITVDPNTHTVWVASFENNQCFVQPFTANQ